MSRATPLMLQIVTGDPRPIARQITDGVKRAIAGGELTAGAALPSVRGLAMQLSVNPNTVAKAYAELTAEGWLESRQGLGVFVAQQRQRLSHAERTRRLDEAVDRFVGDVIGLDFAAEKIVDRVAEELSRFAPKKSA
jgi:GntR family transcriptional regulator